VPNANLTITCANGTKFTLSTGSSAGSCTVDVAPGGSGTVIGGSCYGPDGSTLSRAACGQGCNTANGSGSCSPVN
jgi:hypothetical protein